jgi:hypothetical protein
MDEKRYIAEVRITGETRELTETEKAEVNRIKAEKTDVKTIKNEKVQSEQAFSGGIKKGVTTAIALSTVANQVNTSIRTTNMDLRGDIHGSQQYRNEVSIAQEGLNVLSTLGLGAAFGGLPGLQIAATAVTLQYIMKAIALSNENKRYMFGLEKDLKRMQFEQNRMIKNISGGNR